MNWVGILVEYEQVWTLFDRGFINAKWYLTRALTNSFLSAENTLTPNRGSKNDETKHKSDWIYYLNQNNYYSIEI